MEDLKILIPEDKFLNIGKKKFKIWISSGRSLKATVLFNKLNTDGTDERKALKTDLDFYNAMLDVSMILIRQDFAISMKRCFSMKTVFDWIKRELLTKKYILKNMDIKELADFVDNALEPIIGTKKKELDRQRKTSDALMILIDTMTPEALAKLLQRPLPDADTPKAM